MKPDRRIWSLFVLLCLAVLAASCAAEAPPAPPPDLGAPEDQDLVPKDGLEALQWLLEGNARFAEGKALHDHESQRRRAMLAGGQHPFGIVLGCADSRVPPELIFDRGLGDLFVIRVAGNVVSDDEAGSIEYGIAHLHVPLVVILGHEGCGAVTAALGSSEGEPEELMRLLRRITPALEGIDRSLPMEEQVRLGVEANVRLAARQLAAIAERENRPTEERAVIVGAVYDLDTGLVRIIDR